MQPLKRDNVRLAASVLLLRQMRDGPEVFMLQRPVGVDFPDLHVFPGGKLDDQDLLGAFVSGCDATTADRLLGVNGGGLRYWVAAIRECFEECGVLLARRDGKFLELTEPAEVARFDGYRHQLIDGSLSMVEVCEQENLLLAADCLLYFSHWITPEAAPRRFDTRFFIARMPRMQDTDAHAWETAGSHWVAPQAALDTWRAGDWQMISPTIISLQSIVGYPDVDSIYAAVQAEQHLPELTDQLHAQGMHSLR